MELALILANDFSMCFFSMTNFAGVQVQDAKYGSKLQNVQEEAVIPFL